MERVFCQFNQLTYNACMILSLLVCLSVCLGPVTLRYKHFDSVTVCLSICLPRSRQWHKDTNMCGLDFVTVCLCLSVCLGPVIDKDTNMRGIWFCFCLSVYIRLVGVTTTEASRPLPFPRTCWETSFNCSGTVRQKYCLKVLLEFFVGPHPGTLMPHPQGNLPGTF